MIYEWCVVLKTQYLLGFSPVSPLRKLKQNMMSENTRRYHKLLCLKIRIRSAYPGIGRERDEQRIHISILVNTFELFDADTENLSLALGAKR